MNVVLSQRSKNVFKVDHAKIELLDIRDGGKMIRINKVDLMKEQKWDEVIAPVYKIMEAVTQIGKVGRKKLSRDTNTLLKQRNKLEIEDGILVRKPNNFRQLVLPKVFHSLVYTELHEKLAYLGSDFGLSQKKVLLAENAKPCGILYKETLSLFNIEKTRIYLNELR